MTPNRHNAAVISVVITDGQLRLLPGMKAEPRALSGAPVADGAAAGQPKKS